MVGSRPGAGTLVLEVCPLPRHFIANGEEPGGQVFPARFWIQDVL